MPGRNRPVWLAHSPERVVSVGFMNPFAVRHAGSTRRQLEDWGSTAPDGRWVHRLNEDMVRSARWRGQDRFASEARRVLHGH